MSTISITEARKHLSQVIAEAAAGDVICITRRGKAVAQLTAVKPAIKRPRKPIDVSMLRELTKDMPFQEESAGEFIRRMRDDERY